MPGTLEPNSALAASGGCWSSPLLWGCSWGFPHWPLSNPFSGSNTTPKVGPNAIPTLLVPMLVVLADHSARCLTGVFLRLVKVDTHGHGVSDVIYAVSRSKVAPEDFDLLLRQWIGSSLTIGSGGSAGPEGPIVTIGAVIGSNIGRLLQRRCSGHRDPPRLWRGGGTCLGIQRANRRHLLRTRSDLLRDFSLRTFTPIVIAAVISAATTQTILGSNEPIFGVGPDFFSSLIKAKSSSPSV